MSDAIKKFHDYLAKSPSVVYPEDVLAYLSAIEDENAKLRELALNLYAEWRFAHARMRYIVLQHEERMREIEQRMRELGVEVS